MKPAPAGAEDSGGVVADQVHDGAPRAGRYFSDELGQYLGSGMATSDTLLLGRVTKQEMVPFWAGKTGSKGPVAAHMSKPKLVVSNTLDSTDEWPDSTLIRGDLAEQLTRLKQHPGKDILVIGSARLVRWLLPEGLLDELDLLVFPIVMGCGKRLFNHDGRAALALPRTAAGRPCATQNAARHQLADRNAHQMRQLRTAPSSRRSRGRDRVGRLIPDRPGRWLT
jgi:dihydrofolate reductase